MEPEKRARFAVVRLSTPRRVRTTGDTSEHGPSHLPEGRSAIARPSEAGEAPPTGRAPPQAGYGGMGASSIAPTLRGRAESRPRIPTAVAQREFFDAFLSAEIWSRVPVKTVRASTKQSVLPDGSWA